VSVWNQLPRENAQQSEPDLGPFYASYYAFLAVLFGGTLLGAIAFGIGYGIAELVNWVGVLTR